MIRAFRTSLPLVLLLALLLISACRAEKQEKIRLSVWGLMVTEDWKGIDDAIDEFERRHPNIEVSVLTMGAGDGTSQKLLTSIIGGTPPDLVFQGRHTIGDFASRDVFMPLDDLIKRDKDKPNGIRIEEFYPACVAEATFDGHVYAIPFNTDNRALYYNRKLFREAGLDPDRPPRTWDELTAYSKKLSVYNKDGSFKRLGFAPTIGNSFLYMYSWMNDGEFMDGPRKCTMNNPRTVEALQYMVDLSDELGGIAKINSFASSFKIDDLDAFFTEQLAMKIDGNWFLNRIARYAPDMDFAVAPAPVPTARYEGKAPFSGEEQFITWSGGFSFVIPKGARHVEESWEFIKWIVSTDSTRVWYSAHQKFSEKSVREFVPLMTANMRVNDMLLKDFSPKNRRISTGLHTFFDLMDVSRYRPVSLVGNRIWNEMMAATEQSVFHKKTPQQALDYATRMVQRDLDKIYERETYPLLNTKAAVAVVGGFMLLLALVIFIRVRSTGRLGRMTRKETLAGYLFVSPWVIGFLALTIGPIIASIIFSFCDYDVIHAPRWVGLHNYSNLFGDDWWLVKKMLLNVGYLALFGLPLNLAAGLGIALLLNTKVRGMHWYRTAYYLPAIVPVVANAILWIWMLNPQSGLINAAWRSTFTEWFGLMPPTWLQSEVWSKPALIVVGLWGAGGGMILWLAGLQGVPQHLYEAADLDGANWWQRFRAVTLPMLSPYIFFNLIMGIIGVLQTFEMIYVMTNAPYTIPGGPLYSTTTPVVSLFVNGFHFFKMGFASALAWLLFIIIFALTLLQLKLAPRWVHYEGERGR